MASFEQLEEKLNHHFATPDLLRQALVHRSYLNENPDFPLGHNERLEYLGDAVLELVVSDHLYTHYPNPEGDLTNWRASVVNAKSLSEVAKEIELDEWLMMSRGESRDKLSKARQNIHANAIEAIIGALYLDAGIEPARAFIAEHILSKLPNILANELYVDPKSKFQEMAQEVVGITPGYKVLKEWGPDHDKHFQVGVYLGGEEIAIGEGASKQEAQVAAAYNGLVAKGWNT
ncbi:MAG: ribonuclease III [Candidatus Kerfeldbacteria bacterium]|nr:ribonuclease III [Candidatus Kerfeldbacteria bacterium]